MGSYRSNYQDYHPYPLPDMPPLPRGPPPPPNWYGQSDSYRPMNSDYYPQDHVPRSEFSFRNRNDAPKYPQEQDYSRSQTQYDAGDQDYSRNAQPAPYARKNDMRPRPRNNHRDDVNLNRPRRGNNHNSRPYKVAPADRPLLRRQNDGGNSPDQMLGMATGQVKFMAAGDISDSEEEQMDESGSEKENHEDLRTASCVNDGYEERRGSEPPAKRRATANGTRDGTSEPKWSNPDPYTVLPPVDDEQRKRKDVVKLIRKARRDADDAKDGQYNQVAANDDFISFSMDDDSAVIEDAPSSPSADWRVEYGVGVPGAPSQPRAFSHLQNLHNQANGAPGTNHPTPIADAMGPPPGLVQASTTPSNIPEEFVLDTTPFDGRDLSTNTQDDALGNRKRTHNDVIKGTSSRPMPNVKKGSMVKQTGSLLQEWVPSPVVDPTPWLQRTGLLTTNAGFRLHKEICDFYEFVKPQEFEQVMREELITRLQKVVSENFPHGSVHCFGSYAAGLYLPTADIDVVVVSNSYRSTGHKVLCQSNPQMYRFGDFLETTGMAAHGSVEVITHAKVPIVKFIDRITAIRIDVSFENDTGINANETFAMWKNQFPAMPILVTIIKQFLLMRGLNEVMTGGLGGFSVTCLVTSLLQNMPQVQSGELVPEQHLGEILIEFLDFYGNQLDTTRTGLRMHPPGYFDKRFSRKPVGRQLYNASKADRLAIIDPNRPDNDISGGSAKVLLIFDRFSKAHTEILNAMRLANRPSLLDWLLAGNYESFICQRNHLLDLFTERRGLPAGVPGQYELPLRPGRDLLQDNSRTLRMSTGPAIDRPDTTEKADRFGALKGRVASTLKIGVAPTHANPPDLPATANEHAPKPEPQGSKLPSTRATEIESGHPLPPKPVSKSLQGSIDRANSLKRLFPGAKNIPSSVSKQEKKTLVARLTAEANAKKAAGSTTKKPKASAKGGLAKQQAVADKNLAAPGLNVEKAKRRASMLKVLHPRLAGLIPDAISSAARKAFIQKHGNPKEPRMKPELIAKREPNPPREVRTVAENRRRDQERSLRAQYAPVAFDTARYPTRSLLQKALQTGQQSADSRLYPASSSGRMAPLTEERRAEVARNLSGTSRDDPIDID